MFRATLPFAAAFLSLVGPTTVAHAHGAHGVQIEIHNGALVSSAVEDTKVFHGVDVYLGNFGNRFGIEAARGSFQPGTRVTFDVLDGVKVWNGNDFSTPTPSPITIALGSQSITVSDQPVPGFAIPTSGGGLHLHLDFSLAGSATPGLYLVPLRFQVAGSTMAPTKPNYLVLNHQQHEAAAEKAITYVEDSIVKAMHFNDVVLNATGTSYLEIHVATPGEPVVFFAAATLGSMSVSTCLVELALASPVIVGVVPAVGDEALLPLAVPAAAVGQSFHFQAIEPGTCRVSNWATVTAL